MPPMPTAMRRSDMKLNSIYLAGMILFWAAFPGCSVKTIQAPIPDERVEPAVAEQPEGSGNSYYFYTEAQLYRLRGDLNGAIANLKQAIALDEESAYLKRELAEIFIGNKDHQNALGLLDAILERNPEDVDTLMLYGRLNQKLNRTEEAKDAFRRIISADPKKETAYTILGRIYMAENDLIRADEIFRRLVHHFPASFVGHFYLGKVHSLRGRPKEAIAAFEKTLLLEPGLLEPRFELIDLLRSEAQQGDTVVVKDGETIGGISHRLYGRYDPTVEKAILSINPGFANIDEVRTGQSVLFPKPEMLNSGGRVPEKDEKIIGLYRDILSQQPDNIRAAVELGLFYHEIGNGSGAGELLTELGRRSRNEKLVLTTIVQEYFEKQRYGELNTLLAYMRKGDPDNSELSYISGLTANELGDKAPAVENFREVPPESRFFENAVVNIALIYQEQEKPDKAIGHLKAALKRKPENPEFLLLLGTLYEEKKSYENAEEVLLRAIAIDADNPKLHFRLGVVYDKWGRKDDCIASMKTVIRIDPAHANALNYLGYTYADLGQNLDEAEQLIKRALKAKPDDGYITDSLGWVYYKKGWFKKALGIIKKAVNLVPDDPIILEHLGDVYLELDDKNKALELYERSMKHKKNDKSGIEKKIQDLKGKESQTP